MIKAIEKNQTVDVIESIICDVCKKEYRPEKHANGDFIEIQEFTHIKFTGGYGSVFGDSFSFECDICQHCLKEKLGAYIREVKG
jgi:hypothetical protein